MSHRVAIFDLPISQESHAAVLDGVAERIRARKPGGYISITNTESLYYARRRPENANYIRQAQYSLCDGVGVIVAGWFWGHRIKRYTGPVFQLDSTERGVGEGWRHFYYGGKEGVPEQLALRLAEQFPGAKCVGTYSPPFRPLTEEEDRAIVAMINQTRPDFVWVGLGLLKQEDWIAQHREVLDAPWLVGVGAAFDYHSGTVRWAPPFMRAIGLEWLVRLIREPRLRAPRYWSSLKFVLEAAWHGITRLAFLRKQGELKREVL